MKNAIIGSLYCDGGCICKNPSPYGGTWAYVLTDERDEPLSEASGLILTEEIGFPVTNNLSEFIALVKALEAVPPLWAGRVCSDSNVTLGRFFKGWKITGIPEEWVRRGEKARLRIDLERCRLVLIDGHPTGAHLSAGTGKRGHLVSRHNVRCDYLCRTRSIEYQEAHNIIREDPRTMEA